MNSAARKSLTIPSERINDERGDRILAIGQYNRLGLIIGLPLSLIGIVASIFFLITRGDTISQSMPFIDIIILATSSFAFYYCARELLLMRKRILILTTTRLYGHDGHNPFDFELNDIRSVSEEMTKSQIAGEQTHIIVKATGNRSVKLSQLKDIKLLQQAIREAREAAREAAREGAGEKQSVEPTA
jgi:hypothetical protein